MSQAEETHPAQVAIIRLLPYTGARSQEIGGLQWDWVQVPRLLLRDSKTGPRTVWLGQEAVDLLANHPRSPKVPWIFWNERLRRQISTVGAAWQLVRDTAGLRDFRLHDLRHTFASHAVMNRENLPMIGKLLGHRCIQSTSRYAHLDDAHLIDAAEDIGRVIELALIGGR